MQAVLKPAATFALACVVGLSLFVLMQVMIRADAILEKPDGERAYLNFVRVDQSEETRTKERKLNEPPPPEAPPETPQLSSDMTNVNPNLSMNMPTIGIPINSGDGPYLGALQQGQGLAGFDTDVIPVVRTSPVYPRGAKQARIQGYVTLAVTIRPDGTVEGAEVIESDPPRLFDQSALDAIKRWKFRPKIVDGNPVAQRAKQTIEFKLGGG
ncbi:energy transducer TonB [Mangrovimicrobium sediminis]|nr:energy transducer TonB [Haliea sp. SAOS-164]